MHNAVGYAHFRLVKNLQIQPRFIKAFDRLAAYLTSSGITADTYFSALTGRAIRSRGLFRPWTANLGLPHYNIFVQQELTRQAAQMDGQTWRADANYNRLRPRFNVLSDAELMQDVLKSIAYRRLYHGLSNRHFWLLFLGEFSGAFLHITDEFRRCRLGCFLSSEQRGQWDLLADDDGLAAEIRARCTAMATQVRSQECPSRTIVQRSQRPDAIRKMATRASAMR